MLNSATYGASVSSGLSVAEPKYNFPAVFAATARPTVAVDPGAEDVVVPEPLVLVTVVVTVVVIVSVTVAVAVVVATSVTVAVTVTVGVGDAVAFVFASVFGQEMFSAQKLTVPGRHCKK